MKCFKNFRLIIFMLLISVLFVPVVYADSGTLSNTSNITISSPRVKQVYYKGEAINYYATLKNPFSSSYLCRPFIELIKDGSTQISKFKTYGYMSYGDSWYFKDSFTTSDLSVGTYYFALLAMPIDPYTYQEYGTGNQKYSGRTIYIRQLPAPKKVKAVCKKKKVKISYKKVGAASKYYIYRSKKKKSGYKLIAVTTKTKYTDKKRKKRKTYYYKVKSVRTVNGVSVSAYSKRVFATTK